MRFALNYSPQAAVLLAEGRIEIDLYKCPDWSDLMINFNHPSFSIELPKPYDALKRHRCHVGLHKGGNKRIEHHHVTAAGHRKHHHVGNNARPAAS